MIKQDKDNYKKELKDSINYLKNLGFDNIKADAEGYDNPKSYIKKNSGIAITPDIIAEKNGIKHIFDLSLKTVKPRLLKSKWLFLNTLSQIKSYKFNLITVRGHYSFSNKAVSTINLDNIKMIKL